MLDPTRFRDGRWRRAGASDDQLEALRETHAALGPDAQAAESARIDSVSDDDLAAELAAGDNDPAAGNVDDVLGRVGNDPERAAVVLSHEQAKPRPRARLIAALTAIIDGTPGE